MSYGGRGNSEGWAFRLDKDGARIVRQNRATIARDTQGDYWVHCLTVLKAELSIRQSDLAYQLRLVEEAIERGPREPGAGDVAGAIPEASQ
jgi:hypothetical protein